jgi:hypothetical protein
MPNIIAGHFADFPHAEGALRDLAESKRIDASDIDHVVLGPPGRHDRYPIGGDEDADKRAAPGDKGALNGAALGTAAGAVTGAATALLLGPLGAAATAAVGAYGGSLAGALGKMGKSATEGAPPPRPAGVMVMVHAQEWEQRALALNAFDKNGARSIEEAEGQWRDGTWADFNPVATAHWLVPPSTPRVSVNDAK